MPLVSSKIMTMRPSVRETLSFGSQTLLPLPILPFLSPSLTVS